MMYKLTDAQTYADNPTVWRLSCFSAAETWMFPNSYDFSDFLVSPLCPRVWKVGDLSIQVLWLLPAAVYGRSGTLLERWVRWCTGCGRYHASHHHQLVDVTAVTATGDHRTPTSTTSQSSWTPPSESFVSPGTYGTHWRTLSVQRWVAAAMRCVGTELARPGQYLCHHHHHHRHHLSHHYHWWTALSWGHIALRYPRLQQLS